MATAAVAEPMVTPPVNGRSSSWSSWLPSWRPTSDVHLEEAEKEVLKVLRSEYKELHVRVDTDTYIHTIVFEPEYPPPSEEEAKIPLVMIHGFGCGIPQYYKNYDHLHSDRKLYSIDLPGFARSTRIKFTNDAMECEEKFVDYLEKWREGVGLETFILLGHSLGGFLSCCYSMRHPSRVRHLVLNDPWGFPEKPDDPDTPSAPERFRGRRKVPGFVVSAAAAFMTRFNPLAPLRAAGPLGPYLVHRFRPDLGEKFGEDFLKYVYHSNAQNPSGETAFSYMQIPFAWARHPLLPRIGTELDSDMPITFIYGTRSWMDSSTGDKVREFRPDSYVDIQYVHRAGHHLHAENPEDFNEIVNKICIVVDENRDGVHMEGEESDEGEGSEHEKMPSTMD